MLHQRVTSLGEAAGRTEDQKEEVYFSSAEQIFLSGDYAKAQTTLQSYLERYPEAAYAAKAKFYLAECNREAGNKEQAMDLYLQARAAGLEGALEESALLNYATLNYETGRYDEAYAAYGDTKMPDNLLEQLKRIYIEGQQWEKALAIQDKLDAQNEYDAMSALTRYRIYAMWGKNKQAIKAIDDYLEKDPDNLRFLLFRIELMERMGTKLKERYAMYERILALDPYTLMILNNYAYLLATHKGDLKKAEQMSVITIQQAPDNPVFLDTYGWILHLKGQDELALFYLQRALWNAREERTKSEIEKHIEAIK